MRRVLAGVLAAAPVVAAVAVAAGAPDGSPRAPMTERSFTIRADAFPIEPAPGANQTSVGVRPAATHVALSNAPASAYGRAAAADAGTAELYTGPPPPGSVAECDAAAPNLPRESAAAPAGMALSATCDERPSARTTAIGSALAGASRSSAGGDGGGDALVADATAEVHDISAGAIRLGAVSYVASARADGRPGGAVAAGRIAVSDATVGGVPVVVGPAGVAVDDTKVPTDLLPIAADAVRTALSQGEYTNVRVVQPDVTVAPDGTRAEVRGGGVFFYGTSADPRNNYFLRLTLVGGSVLVALGGPARGEVPGLATPGPQPAAPGGGGEVDVAGPDALAGRDGATAAVPLPSATATSAPDAALGLTATTNRTALPRPWRGWWWTGAAALVLGGATYAGRRRAARWWATAADRYVRG